MYINKRYLDILFYLYKNQKYVTSAELSLTFGMSTKTISREMKKYMQDKQLCTDYGFTIIGKQGHGYKIEVHDKKKFLTQIQKAEADQEQQIETRENREHEIIRILLKNDDYITIADIAEELYSSTATVSAALKNVRLILEEYQLKLDNRPSYGIRIIGSEMNIRLCMSKFFLFTNHAQEEVNYIRQDIDNALTTVLKSFGVFLSDIAREHLCAHILISIERIQEHHPITFHYEEKSMLEDKLEFEMARKLVECLKSYIPKAYQQEETYYIAIQFLSKKSLTQGNEDYRLNPEIEQTVRKIFHEIYVQLGIDLTSDREVFNYLAMHFEPMLVRLKYGIKYSNPLLYEVKTRQATSFEMGLIAKTVIQEEYQYTLNDDEVSCLAIYFSLAWERLLAIQLQKRVLVVCSYDVSSSRMLVHRLKQQFAEYIKSIDVCQYHTLDDMDQTQYDCILSTVDKPIYGKLPVYYLTDFFSHAQDAQIRKFLSNAQNHSFSITTYLKEEYFFIEDAMKDKEEAISYIVTRLKKDISNSEELFQNVMEREQLSSTAYGNFCALPHPIRMCTKENIFSVLILKKGMLWGDKKVKCIFFLSPSKDHPNDLRYFNEALTSFILDSDLYAKFLKNPSYRLLKDLLGEL